MKKYIFVITLVLLLVLIRLSMPYFLLKYVNKTLNRLPDYQGSVEDVDIALIRGAYRIDNIKLDKRNGKLLEPYLKIKVADLSIEWKALFSGKLVGEIIIEKAQMNIVNGDDPASKQVKVKGDWQDVVSDLFPIDINRVELVESEINYSHTANINKKSLEFTSLNGVMNGLTNKANKENLKPADFKFTGVMQNYTKLSLEGDMQPLAKKPTFNLKFIVNP